MKNAVTLPNDVMSDGSRAESESARPNVRSISNKTDVGVNIQSIPMIQATYSVSKRGF